MNTVDLDEDERLGFHCERLAHDRCVSRGCSCFCHTQPRPRPSSSAPNPEPRPVLIDGEAIEAEPRTDGRHNNRGRPALTDEERAAKRAEINVQMRSEGWGYSSEEIQDLTGLTYRQIDYWARTGAMVPSLAQANGSGTQRRWSEQDLRALLVAKRLIDAGLSLASVRGIGEELRELPPGTEGYALIDGDHVEVVTHLRQITEELASGRVVHVMRID